MNEVTRATLEHGQQAVTGSQADRAMRRRSGPMTHDGRGQWTVTGDLPAALLLRNCLRVGLGRGPAQKWLSAACVLQCECDDYLYTRK